MSFKFRYDRLLAYREQLFEREQHELSRIARLAKTIEEECDRLTMERHKCAKAFALRQQEGISADEWLFFSENLEGLEQRLLEEQAKLRKVLQLLEEQRRKLLEARKQVETLKTLREHEQEQHRREEAKEEQKASDEMAIITAGGGAHER